MFCCEGIIQMLNHSFIFGGTSLKSQLRLKKTVKDYKIYLKENRSMKP